MKKFLFAFFATVLILSSCTITTHIHFNKDNSGSVTIEIDYTDMMMEMDDSTAASFKDSIVEPIKQMEGLTKLKNYKMEFKGKLLVLSYDFEDVAALNSSLATMDASGNPTEKAELFTAKKKTISYTAKKSQISEENKDISGEMDDLFKVIFKVSFDRKISKCSNKKYQVNKEEKYILFDGNAGEYSTNSNMNFTVKLK